MPTLEEIEAIQREAHEEGFATGYQEGRREGREQGYKKGQQEGHAEGYQRGYAEGLGRRARRSAVADPEARSNPGIHRRPLENLDATVEEELTWLATEIARRLVRRELRGSPGEIVAVMREAVGLLPVASTDVQVRLHPDDARLIREVALAGPRRSAGLADRRGSDPEPRRLPGQYRIVADRCNGGKTVGRGDRDRAG